MTVRRIEALEPSALLEVRVGGHNSRYYREVSTHHLVAYTVALLEILHMLFVLESCRKSFLRVIGIMQCYGYCAYGVHPWGAYIVKLEEELRQA